MYHDLSKYFSHDKYPDTNDVVDHHVNRQGFGLALAKDIMTPQQLSNTVRNSIVINLLFALGYCAFQLRRFWDE